MAYLWAGATSHVAFVHYDVPPSHIYTIIFYFYKSVLIENLSFLVFAVKS